jgi:uncharacterized protein YodC (DUF2158 family)
MENQDFKVKDIVMVASGSPKMTVIDVMVDECECAFWNEQTQQLENRFIDKNALVLAN